MSEGTRRTSIPSRRERVRLLPSIVLGVIVAGSPTPGAPPSAPNDDPEALAAGLLVRADLPGALAVVASSTAPNVSWQWGLGSPDVRIPAVGFRVTARGSLLVQATGAHRFSVRSDGNVIVRVSGRVVTEKTARALKWEPIELRPGFVPIELEYRHDRGEARLALDWEGPGFPREPVPARLLYHEPKDAASLDAFEEGRRLADRLGCANCHTILDLPRHPNLGPPLDAASREIEPGWLAAWLRDPTAVRPETRMPAAGPGLSAADAADLAAFLRQNAPKATAVSAEVRMALNVATPEKGRLLFRSRGCFGCHETPDDQPAAQTAGVGSAPSLAKIARKRSASALAEYLEHPAKGKLLSRHRPDLRLTVDESAHIAAYLRGPEVKGSALPSETPPGSASRGRTLADRLRCASCHAQLGLSARPANLPLRAGSHADAGCLADGPGVEGVPRFNLSGDQKRLLRAFVAGLPEHPAPTGASTRALDTIRRLNCLGCHTRDGQGGVDLASRLAPLLTEDPALGGLKGILTPPNLTAVGDKLLPEFLGLAVRGEAPVSRPWLSVRMPVFAFEPGEADAIGEALHEQDRTESTPLRPETGKPALADRASLELGARLIGQRGFGCVSCHVLQGRVPPGGEPEALGPDLALAHSRLSERYFHRWIADPQRVIAGTPMPQFLMPVVAEGVPASLDDQLQAVWQLLGSPSLPELAAMGTREVLRREGDRALVVRDMVILSGAPETPYTPRGLAIGLKNGTSLLFDTDRLTWLATWRGGFAYRTKAGRLWEWHPEGTRLWTSPKRLAPVAVRTAGGRIEGPEETRERFGSFREMQFKGDGLILKYRLNRETAPSLDVAETVQPISDGWERLIQVSAVPAGDRAVLVEQVPEDGVSSQNEMVWTWSVGTTPVTLRVEGGVPLRGEYQRARLWALTPRADGTSEARVRLTVGPR